MHEHTPSLHKYTYVRACVRARTHTHTHTHTPHTDTFIHTHVYIHTYMYAHTYTYVVRLKKAQRDSREVFPAYKHQNTYTTIL